MTNNVLLFIVLAILIGILLLLVIILGKKKQLKIVREWLLLAVFKAEKELGDGTGQLKLRFVYDLFIDKFKVTAKFISFTQFCILVDGALIIMKEIITNNDQVKQYLNKK